MQKKVLCCVGVLSLVVIITCWLMSSYTSKWLRGEAPEGKDIVAVGHGSEPLIDKPAPFPSSVGANEERAGRRPEELMYLQNGEDNSETLQKFPTIPMVLALQKATKDAKTKGHVMTKELRVLSRNDTNSAVDVTKEVFVSRDRNSSRHLMKVYLSKYRDLRESKFLKTYPVNKACKNEKRPAVPCNDTECPSVLQSSDRETNLKSVLKDNGAKNPLLPIVEKLGLPPTHLTVVSAASSNHFLESQTMMENLHKYVFPKFDNISFYLYDLGLTSDHISQMEKHCRCRIIQFPFEKLDSKINDVHCYTWKPLIVQAHLGRSKILMWADASIRFNDTAVDTLLAPVTSIGFLVSFSDKYIRPVAHHTSSHMFRYFGMEPCSISNFQELEASFLAFHNEEFTSEILVQSWVTCALDPGCMCPPASLDMLQCDGGVRKYSKCHRFDQSALSLITLKLFQSQYATFFFNHTFYEVKRGHKTNYFHNLEKQSKLNTTV